MIPPATDHASLNALLWDRLRTEGECWLWADDVPASLPRPRISYQGRSYYAYRVAYEAMRGEIPEGLTIDHLCHTPTCCNPWHLEPVPASVNARRQRLHHVATATHCNNGHAWTPENTGNYTQAGELRRYCRQCNRDKGRRYYAAKKARENATNK